MINCYRIYEMSDPCVAAI